METITPHNVNIITSGSKFDGTIEFENYTRFEGVIQGTLRGSAGSELILGQNAMVDGQVEGDTIIVGGFVRGNIIAKSKVIISETGRVIGEIRAPSVAIKFGGFFDGKCAMELPAPLKAHGEQATKS